MPPPDALVLLDTSVVIQLARDKEVGRRIREQLAIERRRERPLVSIVTVGECLALARQFAWNDQKLAGMKSLLERFIVVDVSQPGVLDRYAEITQHARGVGQAPGDNDRWIAATASVTQAWLATTDKDFDFLDPSFLRRVWFDPRRAEERGS